ncbi:MAG: hypothetical protein RLZZ210_198 [Pseudomonadota bacterium]|jgi:hypothetical protein
MPKIKTIGFVYSCINLKNTQAKFTHVETSNCCLTQKLTDEQKEKLSKVQYQFLNDLSVRCTFDSKETTELAKQIYLFDAYNLTNIFGNKKGVTFVDKSSTVLIAKSPVTMEEKRNMLISGLEIIRHKDKRFELVFVTPEAKMIASQMSVENLGKLLLSGNSPK